MSEESLADTVMVTPPGGAATDRFTVAITWPYPLITPETKVKLLIKGGLLVTVREADASVFPPRAVMAP